MSARRCGVEITPAIVAEHGLTPEEYARAVAITGPRAQPDRARHLLGDVERALLLQILARLAAGSCRHGPAGHLRARRERRRRRHRRRRGRDLQDGEPQPPLLHRALPGRGDRRRRHPARRLHHGRAADRQSERAALRQPRPPEDAASRRRRRRRHRRLRQLRRRADGGRRVQFPPLLQRQHPGQRDDRRHRRRRAGSSIPRPRGRAIPWSMSAPRPGATASTAPPWPRPSSTRTPRRSARPCRSAIPSPRSC